MKSSIFFSLLIFAFLAGCGESSEQKLAAQKVIVDQQLAEQNLIVAQQLAAQQAALEQKKQLCVDRANTAFSQSSDKPISEAYDILNVMNLDSCPNDLSTGFEQYRKSVKIFRDINISYNENKNNSGSDCILGGIISLLESADNPGPTPCEDNFVNHVQLTSDNKTAYDNLVYLNRELAQILSRYGRS